MYIRLADARFSRPREIQAEHHWARSFNSCILAGTWRDLVYRKIDGKALDTRAHGPDAVSSAAGASILSLLVAFNKYETDLAGVPP